MRDHILGEIRRLASLSDGRPPGSIAFARDTGIAEHQWRGKFWARWSDALAAAGFEPNEWTKKLDSGGVLVGIIAACRHYGRFPTRDEIKLYRASEPAIPSDQAIRRHFGSNANLVAALATKTAGDESYADIAAMLPNLPPKVAGPMTKPSRTKDGFVYLIKSGEFYKVGRSDDLERRIKEIRVALPDKAELIHSIRTDDPAGIEAYWHNRFAKVRANGEWFKLSSLDVSAFKKRTYQ